VCCCQGTLCKEIEEAKLPSKMKGGILPSVSRFEEFVSFSEEVFRTARRRGELDKAHLRLAGSVFSSSEYKGRCPNAAGQDKCVAATSGVTGNQLSHQSRVCAGYLPPGHCLGQKLPSPRRSLGTSGKVREHSVGPCAVPADAHSCLSVEVHWRGPEGLRLQASKPQITR